MKKPELKLADIRGMMENVFHGIAEATGNEAADLNQEQHRSSCRPVPVDDATNEEVLVCWSAVSARANDITPDGFDSGLLLTGHAESEVTGALILSTCDRLIKVGMKAGAFPNVRVPLAMLADSLLSDTSDKDTRGHA